MYPRARLAFIGALVSVLASSEVGAREPGWAAVEHWGLREGLPHGQVSDLLRARSGYLWLATNGGAARFDGNRFTVFDDRTGVLGDNEVRAVAEGHDGSVWIGTYGAGVTRHLGGTLVSRLESRDGLSSDFVAALAVDREGRLWVGTDGGLSLLEHGRFRTFNTASGLPQDQIRALNADPEGDLWIATRNGGLSRLRDGRISRIHVEGLAPDRNIWVIQGSEARGLWLATYDGVFHLWQGQTRRYGPADGLPSERVGGLHVEPGGVVWAAGPSGVARLDPNRSPRFQPLPTLAESGAGIITSDGEGGALLTTPRGMSVVRQAHFVGYTAEPGGLTYPYTTNLLEDRAGSVWIGGGRGLHRLRGDSFIVLGPPEGLPASLIGALAQDREGYLWVGTDAGFFRSLAPLTDAPDAPGAPLPRFERVPGQPTPTVQSRAMHLASDGSLWMSGVMEGLTRHRDGVFTSFGAAQGLAHPAVRGIVEDPGGAIWVGTRAGLQRFSGGRFTRYAENEGLPHATVEGLHLDQDGVLWVATRRGVARHYQGRFTAITTRHGLPFSYVSGFADDARGNLWLGSTKGVFRLDRREAAELADGKRTTLSATLYGTEHGLVNSSSTGGFHHSVLGTRDGRIWFAMTRGVNVVDPAKLKPDSGPPPVHIEEVRVHDRILPPLPTQELPALRGDLTIRYTGIGLVGGSRMRFRYRLEGHDASWIDAEDRRVAQYANLGPGRYTFRVLAASSDGMWNQTGAALVLSLLPRWYERPTTQVGLVALLALLAIGLHRWRVRQLGRRQRELETRVAERTAELATVNKELEAFSYSASHDLRAPLRALTGFSRALLEGKSEKLDDEGRELLQRMQQDAQRMQRLVDDMLALSRSGRSELRSARVDLSALAGSILRELAEQDPTRRVQIEVAPGLVASGDVDLLRIALGNLLANAWKFTRHTSPARIEVAQGQSNGHGTPDNVGETCFFVRDNGAGFDPRYAHKLFVPFQRLHGHGEFEGTGVGLATVTRIVQRHGGRVWAEGQPGEGATFYFTLP